MSSTSTSQGVVEIQVTFDIGANVDQAALNVNNRVKQAEPRPVQVGEWSGDDWIIQSGLKAGDKVIVDGVARIFAPNSPVQVAEPKKESEKK